MKNNMCKVWLIAGVFLLFGSALHAQSLLPNDTLYIGSATAAANENFIIPVYIRTSQNYQGWQIPLNFGNGTTPVVCDSVTTTGTVMESWVFQAPFTNNNQWDNVQNCGIAGIIDWTGGSMAPGYYLALNVHFTVNGSPAIGTYQIDTTRASWYAGGPQNAYVVTVGGSSYKTHVVQGEINIVPVGIEEHSDGRADVSFEVYPTVLTAGQEVQIRYAVLDRSEQVISVYDGCGRSVTSLHCDMNGQVRLNTSCMQSGVYFVVAGKGGEQTAKKIVIR
jgi:hypothetical protein